jgi:hypothetical protein
MKKLVFITVAVMLLGHIPLIWLENNAKSIPVELARCGKIAATSMIDNPLERLVTRLVLMSSNGGNSISMQGYTLFGIPLSRFSANCETGSIQRL